MKLFTAAHSRDLDRLSQDKYGIPSYSLMRRAGEAIAAAAVSQWPEAVRAGVLVIAGKGNNGGDGFVAARQLIQEGFDVHVILLARAEDVKGDARRALDELKEAKGRIVEADAGVSRDRKFGVVIDAIFGTGLNAEVRGLARDAIDLINASGRPVVAVDIPSGVNADTGAIMGAAVRASLTVTFGVAKFGHVSYPGADCCGELRIADIGFAPAAAEEINSGGCFIEAVDVRHLVGPRSANAHKGTYGHLLIIAGSRGKSGAALLAARGALRMGAGLVTAAIPGSVSAIVAAGQAELMTEPIEDQNGHFAAGAARTRLSVLVPSMSAIVAGPGIGVSRDTIELIEWLRDEIVDHARPLLIDADGLNALAIIGPGQLRQARGPVVLTPHPGEMARLLGCDTGTVNADRITSARRLADLTGAVVLLKGNRSIIASADGALWINSTGNPGMATAGMGDVLSGIVGSLLGQRMRAFDALALGVFLHGMAGDRLARRIGRVGFIASDLADELPAAREALAVDS